MARLNPFGWRTLLLFFFCSAAVVGLAAWSRSAPAPTAWSGAPSAADAPQEGASVQPRAVQVTARKYAFSPQVIEVQQDDLVKITLEAADIPHSFTIDEPYRIAKRAAPGHPVVFEFRADKAGTFPFYCNLAADDGCKKMRGELVVKARK